MFKNIDHLVITVKDPDASRELYWSLGFEVIDTGSRLEFHAGSFKLNAHILGKELEPKAKNVAVGSADFCIELDIPLSDFIAKTSAKSETGIISRHGIHGEMHSVYYRDLDGNLLEFCNY